MIIIPITIVNFFFFIFFILVFLIFVSRPTTHTYTLSPPSALRTVPPFPFRFLHLNFFVLLELQLAATQLNKPEIPNNY